MRLSLASLLALALSTSAAACGSTSDNGLNGPVDDAGDAGETGPTLAELPAKVATAQCAALTACVGPLVDLFLGGSDCEARVKKQIDNSDISQWQAALDAGKATYHPSKAQACIDTFANGGCAALSSRDPDACVAAFDGTVTLGGACTYSFECTGLAFCKADATCPGVCSARLTVGQTCKVDDDCQDGLSCDKDSKLCTQRGGLNEVCKGPTAPDCATGLMCYGSDDQKSPPVAGTCKAVSTVFAGAEGASCSFDGKSGPLCATGLMCAFQSADQAGLHASCVKPVASGAACKASIPSMCPKGEYCDAPKYSGSGPLTLDGHCVALPTDGQACAQALAATDACAPDTVCDSAGTCHAIAANGAACTFDDACWSASCQSGKCQAHTACTP